MTKKIIIDTEEAYHKTMARLEKLALKGSEKLTDKEYEEIGSLSVAAQQYEQKQFRIEPPETLAGMIELKMFQLKIKQNELAKKLHVSEAKLSLIMNGKQKPDIHFLKSVYKELQVDAAFILEHA